MQGVACFFFWKAAIEAAILIRISLWSKRRFFRQPSVGTQLGIRIEAYSENRGLGKKQTGAITAGTPAVVTTGSLLYEEFLLDSQGSQRR